MDLDVQLSLVGRLGLYRPSKGFQHLPSHNLRLIPERGNISIPAILLQHRLVQHVHQHSISLATPPMGNHAYPTLPPAQTEQGDVGENDGLLHAARIS